MTADQKAGQTTPSSGSLPSESSLLSEPFTGPFIIEAVALSVSVLGIIGGAIALLHMVNG
jgi:hypothetical protein